MPSAFPVPRMHLPTVRVSVDEPALREQQAQRLLQHTLDAYEEHISHGLYHPNRLGRLPNTRRWKHHTSMDTLTLYKERKAFLLPSSSDKQAWLLMGEKTGRMEDAMYALSCQTHEQLALLSSCLYGSTTDCAILTTLPTATEADDPYRSLTYQWVTTPVSSSSLSVSSRTRHRDAVFLASSGTVWTKSGDKMGYFLLQSLALASFPPFRDRRCVRSSCDQSIRTLFRQSSENTVEIFMLADIDAPVGRGLSLRISSLSSSPPSLFTQETLLAIATGVIACGEIKRLTMVIQDRRRRRISERHHHHGARSSNAYHEAAVLCSLCRQEKRLFNTTTLSACEVCEKPICNKCRENRRIFTMDVGSATGRLETVSCCPTCTFNAAQIRPEASSAWTYAPLTARNHPTTGLHRLQSRSTSVASTVPSEGASIDTAAMPLSLSSPLYQGTTDITVRSSSMTSLNRRSLSGNSVGNEEDDQSYGSCVTVGRAGHVHYLTDAHAHAVHQRQLYLRMQQLTQLAEQTYHTSHQHATPTFVPSTSSSARKNGDRRH